MPRRKKRNNDEWIFLIAKMAGLCALLAFVNPAFIKLIPELGALLFQVLLFVGGLLVLALLFLLARRLMRKDEAQQPLMPQEKDEHVASVTVWPAYDLWPVIVPDHAPVAASLPTSAANLGDSLRKMDWFQFEKAVAVVYRKLGYNVPRRGGANPDGGIDLIIEKDGQRTAIQCKQWKTWNVGVKAIREFLGALTDGGIQRGIFITLQGYSSDAKQLADKHGIEILNETGLVKLFEQTDARFDPEVLAALNDPRKFCPKCEAQMVLRTAKKGPDIGQQFWGCSTYPRCKHTMQC